MHRIGPESPHSAHVACARVCRQLCVLRASHALVQATVGVGTVYIGVAYTGEGGQIQRFCFIVSQFNTFDFLPAPASWTKPAGSIDRSPRCRGPLGGLPLGNRLFLWCCAAMTFMFCIMAISHLLLQQPERLHARFQPQQDQPMPLMCDKTDFAKEMPCRSTCNSFLH